MVTLNTNSTAHRIIETTQELIQTLGYNAISFNDIAELVGIKKPSIVHHFPNKAALVVAVVNHYRDTYSTLLTKVCNGPNSSTMDAFDAFCTPYISFAASEGEVCLCGALAGEYRALPTSVQSEVTRFFKDSLTVARRSINSRM
ncbi:MAG: TetR/AcrR family transcriptional repressor of nem operon [Lentisphaeria bacterium]